MAELVGESFAGLNVLRGFASSVVWALASLSTANRPPRQVHRRQCRKQRVKPVASHEEQTEINWQPQDGG
jgi:hypothetical protein